MGEGEHDDAGRAHALRVAAALAVLGVSVGVNVQELIAADTATMQSDQGKMRSGFEKFSSTPPKRENQQEKFDATQQKLAPATPQKLPSRQDKDRVMPGVKPLESPR